MSKTILCVDDSATMQTVCEITFRVSDYQYVGARSAAEALQKAKAQTPALVLADATMPDKSGYDLCRELKSDPGLAGVPVILVCGNSAPYDAAAGAAAGADGHLVKPWDTTKLLEQLGALEKQIADKGVVKPGAAAAPADPGPAPKPAPAAAKPAAPAPAAPAPVAKPAATPAPRRAPTAGAAAPSVAPLGGPQLARPATPAPAPRAATPAPAPRAATPSPAPRAATPAPINERALPTPPAGMDRPPMIKGVPTKRPQIPAGVRPATNRPAAPRSATLMGMPNVQMPPAQGNKPPGVTSIPSTQAPAPAPVTSSSIEQAAAAAAAAVPAAAQRAAAGAGLDPSGPEVAALVKMSREVIEQVVWEVVPQLAETIIKENLDRLAASK